MQFLGLLSVVCSALVLSADAASHSGSHRSLARRLPADVGMHRRATNSKWTWYDTETGNAGSCGRMIKNTDFVVAMNAPDYESSDCFKQIVMNFNGKTATATVGDLCPVCPPGGLDLSRGLFQHFSDLGAGIIFGEWHFAGEGEGGAAAPPNPDPTTSKAAPTTTPKPSSTSTPKPSSTFTPEPSSTSTPPPATSSTNKNQAAASPTSSSTKASATEDATPVADNTTASEPETPGAKTTRVCKPRSKKSSLTARKFTPRK